MFQTFRGSPALSEFRIQGLMQKFQQNQLPVKSVYAEYLHFVELNRPLVSEQEAKLKALLHLWPNLGRTRCQRRNLYRDSTRWHRFLLGLLKRPILRITVVLSEVERIERGLAYYFELSQPLDEKQQKIDRTFTRQNDGNGGASSLKMQRSYSVIKIRNRLKPWIF